MATTSFRARSKDELHLIADRFRALAEPSRLLILSALRPGELNVTQLAAATGFGQANLSKHLQVLLRVGFVQRRREGVSIYYRIADPDVFRICDLVCGRLEREAASLSKLFAGR